jgi:cell wall-associated NlpC family hydrolase
VHLKPIVTHGEGRPRRFPPKNEQVRRGMGSSQPGAGARNWRKGNRETDKETNQKQNSIKNDSNKKQTEQRNKFKKKQKTKTVFLVRKKCVSLLVFPALVVMETASERQSCTSCLKV